MNQKGNKDNPNECIVKCNLKSLYHVQSMFTLNGLSKKKKKMSTEYRAITIWLKFRNKQLVHIEINRNR